MSNAELELVNQAKECTLYTIQNYDYIVCGCQTKS